MRRPCVAEPLYKWKSFRRGPINVVIAQTPCQKMQGLQGINKIPFNTVMLFEDIPGGIYFHTMNCHFPMEIIPLDGYGNVLKIFTAQPNNRYIGPMPGNTIFVVEANVGWSSHHGVRLGRPLPYLF